jgi:hypothetical protein
MPVSPVVLHISGRSASFQMRDTVTGKVEIERPAPRVARGEATRQMKKEEL